MKTLREILPLACQLGLVHRALTWDSILRGLGDDVSERYGRPVARWLRELLVALEAG